MAGWDEVFDSGYTTKVQTPRGTLEVPLVVHVFFDTSPYSVAVGAHIDLLALREGPQEYRTNNQSMMQHMAAAMTGEDPPESESEWMELEWRSLDTDKEEDAAKWPGAPEDHVSPRDMDGDEAMGLVDFEEVLEKWSKVVIPWSDVQKWAAEQHVPVDLSKFVKPAEQGPEEPSGLPDTEDEIIRQKPARVTSNYVLAVYQKAKDLRSNKLMAYARKLSSEVRESSLDNLVRRLLDEE